MQLILDRAILEQLRERAATASQLVGHMDERAGATHVESLADSIDEIVHVLSELLGNPHVVVSDVPGVPCAAPAALATEATPVAALGAGGAR